MAEMLITWKSLFYCNSVWLCRNFTSSLKGGSNRFLKKTFESGLDQAPQHTCSQSAVEGVYGQKKARGRFEETL